MSVRPYRVRNDDPHSWAYFPVVEARCLAFIQKHGVDFDLAPFRAELRARFNDPVLDRHRLYVFLDPQGAIVGHMLAWVDVAYNRSYVHVHQLECDDDSTIRGIVAEMFREIELWVQSINATLAPNDPRALRNVEFWTWRNPEVWKRYLQVGCDLQVSRYVLKYAIANPWAGHSPSSSVPSGSGLTSRDQAQTTVGPGAAALPAKATDNSGANGGEPTRTDLPMS